MESGNILYGLCIVEDKSTPGLWDFILNHLNKRKFGNMKSSKTRL